MTDMTKLDYLEAVRGDSEAFLNAAGPTLDQPIAHLGDWTMRELVTHLGQVYSLVIANIAEPGTERVAPGEEANAPEGDRLTEWFAERRATLLEGFERSDSDTEVWTFTGPQTVGWWLRRMASETMVHRWDAETVLAAGPGELDSDLAKDGIDEYTDVGLHSSSSRPTRVYPNETLHLHRTDGPGEWMFARGDNENSAVVTEEHGKGDAAVRGPAAALLLWIWGRPADGLEIFGDPDVAAAWQAVAP